MRTPHVVILGAGHAAAQLAPSLRQHGWQGDITLVGEEPVLPYQRPPLSKAYLAGQMTPEQMLIKNAAAYEKAGVNVRLGVRALRIDRALQQVHLDTGEVLDYSALALTLGARVRELAVPGAQLPGVFYLRTIADLDRIKAHATSNGCQRAVIVGGGYIGLETAAGLRQLGFTVSLLEAMPKLLQRVTSAEVSDFYHRVHTEEGVDIRYKQSVMRILGDARATAVQCESGETFPADLVVIGIGVLPNVELAAAAGLEVGNGI
ncbi:MAG TPA: FAD-dependent oxidoreductase, partial [Hydrogenophaga sp.]|nr:FAD-dependent oxidoreductase [Hydrogenophaga sp.]